MRFVVHMHFDNGNDILLPPWYRIGFASMIKEALRQDATSKMYELYYGNAKKNRPKPFTFAVKLNVADVEKSNVNYLRLGNPFISFYISSNDYEFIMTVYNGLLKLKQYAIYNNAIIIDRFNLLPEKTFPESKAVFDIFSPIVVRKVDENKKGTGYVNVNDSNYKQMLFYSIRSQCKFLGDSYLLNDDDVAINTSGAFTVKIPHYNKRNPDKPEIITAIDGCIAIQAPNEVLQLIYDIGLGARRSQGFGMLEVAG